MFNEAEITYLQTQPLARIATVSPDGQPDVAPVTYEFDGTYFYISGRATERTLKHKNVAAGQRQVALVVDDLASIDPWRPRGIKVHGTAAIVATPHGAPALRITPTAHWAWGIAGSSYEIIKTDHAEA